MEIGDEEDTALKHSKFHKAKREFLRSKSHQSEDEAGASTSETTGLISTSISPESYQFHTSEYFSISRRTEHQTATSPSFSFGTKEGITSSTPLSTTPITQLIKQQSWAGTSSSSSVIEIQPPISELAEISPSAKGFPSEVFRFDSTDRERYLCSAISEEEEVFTHEQSLLAKTSFESPHIILESPTSTAGDDGSQLHLAEPTTDEFLALGSNTALLTPHSHMDSQSRIMARVHTGLAMLPSTTVEQSSGLFGGIPSSPISPLTPNTPLSPSPLFSSDQMLQQGFLAELYRRRCHSDSDLPFLPDQPIAQEPTDLSMKTQQSKTQVRPRKPIPHPLTIPAKGGSLESEQSTPQDSPLDLSIRTSRDRVGSSNSCESLTTRFLSSLAIPVTSPGSVAVIRGDIASPTTRNSVALRYNLDVSPVVEEMPPGADMAFVCPICGQMFSLHDRLAKHMASRHKSKPHDPNKNYPCDVCHRSFARSDMLTRHMRLHTGVKPYTCRTCGQVFSRSDHLSTHQRTHTGEKPYKCPQCCYSACRRDMITRHLRTHTRNSSTSSSSDVASTTSTPTSTTFSTSDSFPSSDELRPIKIEPSSSSISTTVVLHSLSRPPSSASSFAPDSPLSPALNMSGLSVQSPQTFFQKDP